MSEECHNNNSDNLDRSKNLFTLRFLNLLFLTFSQFSRFFFFFFFQETTTRELGGYVKGDGNLKFMLLRNAGHSAPMDQPQWALRMVEKFWTELCPQSE